VTVPLAARLGLGLALGHLAAGIVNGPVLRLLGGGNLSAGACAGARGGPQPCP
jgi:hypothetical protein